MDKQKLLRYIAVIMEYMAETEDYEQVEIPHNYQPELQELISELQKGLEQS